MGETTKIKLPRGVTIRRHAAGETINITFTFKGVKCREPLSNLEVNTKNIKYAERLLSEVNDRIEKKSFIYVEYFPKSSKLELFGGMRAGKIIGDYLDEYLRICAIRKLSPSTITGYKKCKNQLADMHKLPVEELTPAILKQWIQRQTIALKTIRNVLSFLRSAIDEAVIDGLTTINPVSLVKAGRYQTKHEKSESAYVVDPFTPAEISALLSATSNPQWGNLFLFAFSTGMRSSELCSLRWDEIDFVGRTAHVTSASVEGILKGTKTKAGTRKIELNDQSMSALASQKAFTFMKAGVIFDDPKTNLPWAGADAIRKKAWAPTLRKAGVRYRNPYQTRHTYATRHISQGANLFWLAAQMGHKGPEMLFRHYGSYLKEYDGKTGREFSSQTGS
ncbi:TPA: Arm DNA-binding domain-containing protein [Serratia fonticola]